MQDFTTKKHVCIHGHFYQPPRDNPWLDAIEREDSATPYHDWNERIDFECYRANTAARLVDEGNRVLSLHNNYEWMSFNFGPTLLRWLEVHDPWAYAAIQQAERDSRARLGGHGNAMAQVYNHMIMPLANRRDKITQVLWGVQDFKARFGHLSEGMWLAETAVDGETLGIMAEAGVKFTVLSPFQAARWRFTDQSSEWEDVSGGSIPTGRAYRCRCPGGRSIVIFFYDPSLARGIAFDRLLEHSSKLVGAIHRAHEDRGEKNEPWLVHSATDGESYGHHFKFGDMALAAALEELRHDPETEVINYGSFLARYPVRAEVEILENTSWSCAHGVGRWERDCGCNIGGRPGWSQKWRGPLRESLNSLRDALAVHYEREMGMLAEDPWRVRDEYIDVLLHPWAGKREEFVRNRMTPSFDPAKMPRFLQLLEMQRCAMFMFTSCGWFFDEISGLESKLILRWASRAIQLAERAGATSLMEPFLELLDSAQSNDPSCGTGADVFRRATEGVEASLARVAANCAIRSLAQPSLRESRLYCFEISPLEYDDLGCDPAPLRYGRVSVKDSRTGEEEAFLYASLHFEGLDFRCSVKPHANSRERADILAALQKAVEEQNTVKLIRTVDERLGTASFTLHDVFHDLRSDIALEISRNALAMYTSLQRHLYQIHGPLISSLRQWGVATPPDLRGAVRRVLVEDVDALVESVIAHRPEVSGEERRWSATDFFHRSRMARLQSIWDKARSWSIAVQTGGTTSLLGEAMVETLTALKQAPTTEDAGRLHRLMDMCRLFGSKPALWRLQTLFYEFASEVRMRPETVSGFPDFKGFVNELDDFLNCRFARILAEVFERRSLSTDVLPRDLATM